MSLVKWFAFPVADDSLVKSFVTPEAGVLARSQEVTHHNTVRGTDADLLSEMHSDL